MDKASGELDQSFVEGVIRGIASILQPEVLQHIVRLVVAPGVETLEISEIAGIEGSLQAAYIQSADKLLQTLRFFHVPV